MKLEIELDLNQIDYGAINKQIQDKIAEMNIHEEYKIDSKINDAVKREVDETVGYRVRNHLSGGPWNSLNNESKNQVRNTISNHIKELVEPHVKEIFDQIPEEELNKLISDLIPRVMMDVISAKMLGIIDMYYNNMHATTYQICEERVRNILNRPY